jgi:hypothetical protein
MKQYAGLLLLGLSLVTFNCKKNEAEVQTNTQLISSSSWKYDDSGLDINKDGVIDTNVPAGYLLQCDLDNQLTFKADGSGIVDEGASKCEPASPQTAPFNWEFKNGETEISFSSPVFSGFGGDVKIKSLTTTKLALQKEINIGAPTTVNIIVNLKH